MSCVGRVLYGTSYGMKKILWSIFEVIETVTIAVVAVFLVRTFVAQPFLVSGASMEPTFQDGNYVLIDELSYRLRAPDRGEVIVFKYPGDHRSYYIKRIIGLPGERVVIQDGAVTVYDATKTKKLLREPYIAATKSEEFTDMTLAPDQYFVMGDNRDFSFDSRKWGPLTRQDIVGFVRFRLWPVNEAMAFGAPKY